MEDDEELEQLKADSRKAIDEWIDGMPEESRDRLRAFNWNLQQRVDKFDKPEDQMNEILAVFAEQAQKLNDACEGILPEERPDNVISFPSPVDPSTEK